MESKTLLNSDFHPFYNYLTLCALEKRGKHQLTDISADKKIASNPDLKLLKDYLELAQTNLNHSPEQLEFLQDIQNHIKDPSQEIEIHLTRDSQVIETGNN